MGMIANGASIQSQLEQMPGLPALVQSWRVEEGINSMDDPAVWVWALTKQDIGDEARDRLKMIVREFVSEVTGGWWAYVLVRELCEDDVES